jgi:hypothetical protein
MFKRFSIIVLLVLGLSVSGVFAQETPAAHSQDASAAVLEPTAVPLEVTPEPTPVPPPVVVIDSSQIPQWVFLVVLVLVLGVVSVAFVGILQAAKGLPEWVKPILIGAGHTGLDTLDTYVGTTPNTLDDEIVEELRRRLEDLEAGLIVQQQSTARVVLKVDAVAAKVQESTGLDPNLGSHDTGLG